MDNHSCFYMNKFFLLFFVLFDITVLLSVPVSVSAIQLSPTFLEYEMAKGTSMSQTVHLKNDSSSRITVAPSLYAVVSQDERGFPELASLPVDASLRAWIGLADSKGISLAPGQEKDIPVTVSIPKTAKAGGQYAVVTWNTKGAGGPVGLSLSPGVNIAITVPGAVEHKASVAQFSRQQQSWFGLSLPLVFVAKVRNDGGVHFYPEGTIEIKNIFGSVVARVPVLAQKDSSLVSVFQKHPNGSILPGSTRELYGTWDGAFAFGPYTATLALDTQEAGRLMANQSFFITAPVLSYVGYALASLCIVLLLRFFLTLIDVVRMKK